MAVSPSSTGPELLREASRVVIKFGGDNAGEFMTNLQLVRELLAEGKSPALVFSAIRSSDPASARFSLFDLKKDAKNASQFNTTSHLIEMAKGAEAGNFPEAERWLNAVQDFTCHAVGMGLNVGVEDAHYADRAVLIARLVCLVREECDQMRAYLREACEVHPLGKAERFFGQGANGSPVDRMFASNLKGKPYVSFTGFGEALAEKIYTHFLKAMNVPAVALESDQLSATVFGDTPKEAVEKRSTIVDHVCEELRAHMQRCLEEGQTVLVSGGRLPGAAESRGYSDVAAVVLAEAMTEEGGEAPLVWIAKQGPIESIDPKLLSDPQARRLVGRASLPLSEELFDPNGADAGALHTDAAKRLKAGMNVVIGSPGERTERLSWVSADHDFKDEKGVKAVAMVKIPQVLTVRGGDMVERPGVMDRVLEKYRHIIVGHTHTDAGTVNVTFHSKPDRRFAQELEDLLRELYDRNYRVQIAENRAWVFCVGDHVGNEAKAKGYATLASLEVEPQFELGSPSCWKFVVPEERAKEIVLALHSAYFESSDTLEA